MSAGAVAGVLGAPALGTRAPGLNGEGAAAWVARLVAATRAAGSAHVQDTQVTQLTTNGTQDQTTASSGSGDVAFGEDAFWLRGLQRQTLQVRPGRVARLAQTFTAVTIGRTLYITSHRAGTSRVRRRVRIEPGVIADLSVQPTGSPYGPLATPASTQRVEDLGPSVVGGVPVHEYRLIGAARSCPPTARSPTVDVWVDGHGRLVRVRSVVRVPLSQTSVLRRDEPTLGSAAWLTMTTVAFLSHYGIPVRVAAPFTRTTPPPRPGLPPTSATYPLVCHR